MTATVFGESQVEAARGRHLARLAHAHRLLYGTDDRAKIPPMAREQIAKIYRDWSEGSARLPLLVALDRLSQPAN